MSFPSLRDPIHMDVRFKSVKHLVYLCVTRDSQGKHLLGTKTLSLTSDPEVDFSLYYYTHSEAEETKLVLPVHQSTNVCLSMTSDKRLAVSCLVPRSHRNEVDSSLENPLEFTTADNRFFYIKAEGSMYALEAMNGVHYKHYLAVKEGGNGTYVVDIKEHTSDNYPDDILFEIQERDE